VGGCSAPHAARSRLRMSPDRNNMLFMVRI
jgi:hypothetical protein